jgi:hypothetical protein
MEWNEELFYVFNYDKPTGGCCDMMREWLASNPQVVW